MGILTFWFTDYRHFDYRCFRLQMFWLQTIGF